MNILAIVLSVVFGVVSGVLGGLGMGGGTLLIPLLTIFLNFDQKLAQGINLISFLVMALISLIIHAKNGYIKAKGVLPLVFFGVIFSCVGAFVVSYIPTDVLRRLFGVFLCVLALIQVIKIIKK